MTGQTERSTAKSDETRDATVNGDSPLTLNQYPSSGSDADDNSLRPEHPPKDSSSRTAWTPEYTQKPQRYLFSELDSEPELPISTDSVVALLENATQPVLVVPAAPAVPTVANQQNNPTMLVPSIQETPPFTVLETGSINVNANVDGEDLVPETKQQKEDSGTCYFKPEPGQTGSTTGRGKAPAFDYHFKLISVAFKEAALDSPSFRASMNHLDSQLSATEKWIQAIAALIGKIPKQAKELLSLFLYLEYLVPSFLQDGIVDQEYTLTALRGARDGLQKLWAIAQSALQMNMPSMDAWERNILARISKYKIIRQKFNKHQRKYDHFLGIHMSMLKGKDPALLLEDSQQLAVVRNEYLKVSLDVVVELAEVSQFINRHLINFVYKIWQEKVDKLGGNPFVYALFSELWDEIRRIHCWCETYRKSSLKMYLDMLRAKKNIEEHSIALSAPSRHIDDYKSDHINRRFLEDIDEVSTEKHGYLFMKTYTEKSKQPIWVRRWAFLQGGVLGFFVLDPSLTSVQETDKIGVLLCNVKYSPNEDRSFCFEVKTIDTSIVLQAETLKELKSWLKVFSNMGNRVVKQDDPMHGLLKVASGRYPPLVLEFLSTANTSADRDLTHARIQSSSGQIITSSKLSAHLEKSEAFFERYIYDQVGRIYLPFVTETTRSALVAYNLTGSTVVPSALSANIWGSLNWGLYYLYESNEGVEESQKGLEDLEHTASIIMPKEFPNTWAARDIQLKALFESAVEPGEFCMLSYHCLLSPNPDQSLRGTHFVTQRHIYSYIQSLGFISLSKIPLGRILKASVRPMQDYSELKLVLILGQLKMKLYLDDCRLVEKKMKFLLKCNASDSLPDIGAVITQLMEIEEAHAVLTQRERLLIFGVKKKEDPPPSLDFLPTKAASPKGALELTDSMPLVTERIVDLPPQALLHVLFGSKSRVFMDLYQVMDVRLSDTMPWLKAINPNNDLQREFEMDVLFLDGKPGRIVINQVIEKFIENELYSIKVRNSTFKMKYGPLFDYSMRFLIQRNTDGQSLLKFYGSANINASFIARLAPLYLINSIIPLFCTELSGKVKEAVKKIGPTAQVARSNYLYGRITVTEAPPEVRTCPPIVIDNAVICNWCFQIKLRQVTRQLMHLFKSAVGLITSAFMQLRVHRILLGIIFCLVLSNLFFGVRSTAQYWKTRQVEKLVTNILNVEPINIHRAIYSKDVQDFVNYDLAAFSDGACFQVFKNHSVVLNPDKLHRWSTNFNQIEGTGGAELKRRLNDIALERNQLLLSLATLNQMEEEIARTEWANWLYTELRRCEEIKRGGFFSDFDGRLTPDIVTKLSEYCGSCSGELDSLARGV